MGMKQFNPMTNVTSEVLLHDLSSPMIKLLETDVGRGCRKLFAVSGPLTPQDRVHQKQFYWGCFLILESKRWELGKTEGLDTPRTIATFEGTTLGPLQASKDKAHCFFPLTH